MTHEHDIKSVYASFLIDPNDRGIYKQSPGKISLIQGDHNSKRFSFRIPRYIEGHDTSLCDKINVHYVNVSTCKTKKSEDIYLVKDRQLDPEDENFVIFSWLISGNATKHEGVLSFLVEFLCFDGEECTYSWHTDKHIEFIGEGMNNSAAVAEKLPDILTAWEAEVVKNATNKAVDEANEILDNELNSLKEADETNATAIETVDAKLEYRTKAWYANLGVELVPPTSVGAGIDSGAITSFAIRAENQEFLVDVDGEKYECVSKFLSDGTYGVGNLALLDSSFEDTGESFLWLCVNSSEFSGGQLLSNKDCTITIHGCFASPSEILPETTVKLKVFNYDFVSPIFLKEGDMIGAKIDGQYYSGTIAYSEEFSSNVAMLYRINTNLGGALLAVREDGHSCELADSLSGQGATISVEIFKFEGIEFDKIPEIYLPDTAIKEYVDEKIGDISTALDAIITKQNAVIGGV